MIKKVIKRDGSEVDFDVSKIEAAIFGANLEVEKKDQLTTEKVEKIVNDIVYILNKLDRAVEVEDIQEIVENKLMENEAYEVAKHYIRYRYEHKLLRENKTDLQIMSLVEYQNESVKQ